MILSFSYSWFKCIHYITINHIGRLKCTRGDKVTSLPVKTLTYVKPAGFLEPCTTWWPHTQSGLGLPAHPLLSVIMTWPNQSHIPSQNIPRLITHWMAASKQLWYHKKVTGKQNHSMQGCD